MMRTKPFPKIIAAMTLVLVLFMSPPLALAQNHFQRQRTSVINVKVGRASWYSKSSSGVKLRTANREIFDDSSLTCAMWGVPFNQMVRVTNLANGKSVVVRVNDRGPHKRFVRKGRIVDLSKNAFMQIASLEHGLIKIRIEFL
jgi:rare lipoprotein A